MIKRNIELNINTNNLVAKLNSIVEDNSRYSYKGLFNDYDLFNSSQWVMQKGKNEKEFLLYKTSNATTSNYLVSYLAKLTIIDSDRLKIFITYKTYVWVASVLGLLMFITLIILSIIDGNPMFILYIIALIIGGIVLTKDIKKFEKIILKRIKNLIDE